MVGWIVVLGFVLAVLNVWRRRRVMRRVNASEQGPDEYRESSVWGAYRTPTHWTRINPSDGLLIGPSTARLLPGNVLFSGGIVELAGARMAWRSDRRRTLLMPGPALDIDGKFNGTTVRMVICGDENVLRTIWAELLSRGVSAGSGESR